MTAGTKKVMTINFYPADRLPGPLAEKARGKVNPKDGLVAVKTILASPPTYEFEVVGSTPEQIKAYYEKLAREDNAELDEVAKRTLSGE